MKKIVSFTLIVLLLCGCTSAPSPTTQQTQTTAEANSTEAVIATQPTASPSTTSASEEDPVATLLNNMTIEQRVGQLFLARCPDQDAVADIGKYHLGGYILFGRDFKDETPDSVRTTLESYQNASEIPMLIAVDEEGGLVNRVSRYQAFRSEPFPSVRELYAQGGLALIRGTEKEKAELLLSLGINVNVGPVCDIATDPEAFMYDRSLGQSPEIASDFVKTMVEVAHSNQIGCVLKHFPGYGNNTDTHVAIAVDDRPLSQLESVDLIPFAAGIEAGCDAIMVSHIYINAIDLETPATLSPAVHSYLRENMGFDGVIVTDDLSMQAITDVYGVGESAVLAVLAGNDLLCVTDYKVQYEAVLEAVADGRISETLLNQAAAHVLRWKMKLGLL